MYRQHRSVVVDKSSLTSYFLAASLRLAVIVMSYSASLNANKNAAVSTLCVILGPIPNLSISWYSSYLLISNRYIITRVNAGKMLMGGLHPEHHKDQVFLYKTLDSTDPRLQKNIESAVPRPFADLAKHNAV